MQQGTDLLILLICGLLFHSFFWWHWGLNQGLMFAKLAKQVLYNLSHFASPALPFFISLLCSSIHLLKKSLPLRDCFFFWLDPG
jgi:hypothetical protein